MKVKCGWAEHTETVEWKNRKIPFDFLCPKFCLVNLPKMLESQVQTVLRMLGNFLLKPKWPNNSDKSGRIQA